MFLFANMFLFAQEKLIKKSTFQSEEIEIITDGLDDVVIETATSNQIEVILLDENPNTHTILITEENDILKVGFKLNFNTFKEPVFRKYITKRLQRAAAIIKIPKNKIVSIYGKTIAITSKSYNGDLSIYIDKGTVNLHKVKRNALVQLFLGNVSAVLSKKSAVSIETKNGEIRVNENSYKQQFYTKNTRKAIHDFKVRSMNANVLLITE
ncbi:hypothetical protein [Tenacibaculum haliotis]|uniref:hypothetical protein n=1 Tax=Tenacibaculum haliotis TaxID=1888914 RepID=UPI0021AFE6B6|nr:hypothetical protein [Tenacibaculum haliotis]MCT4699343.1 hypothetical protein [Tenacibaculum haliotis]